jgi:gelsolin
LLVPLVSQVGSELHRKIRNVASQLEPAWDGIGKNGSETRVWRIEKFKVVPWPRENYGMFHKGDSYIGT